MAREEDDFEDDERVTRATRRTTAPTARLSSREIPQSEPVRSDWLSSRTAGRTNRRRGGVPSSRQEFVLWLQHGGWRTVALVAAATFAAIVLMVVVANRANPSPLDLPQPTLAAGVGGNTGLGALATTDPLLQPSVTPAAPEAGAGAGATSGAQFRVINTGEQGLFLRSDHTRDASNVVETLPDGTTVTVIGEDFAGSDYVWKKVRSPSGKEGWVASDFLERVQP